LRVLVPPRVTLFLIAVALALATAQTVQAQIPPTLTPTPGLPDGASLTTTATATLTETPTPTATSTQTLTPTASPTRTPTPYPTFLPGATPTLAWPSPGPSAFFVSRYIASVPLVAPPKSGSGGIRGRVVDWRGLGLQNFRVQVSGATAQAEAVTTADGHWEVLGLPPGAYEVTLPDYRSVPAGGVPVLTGQITTLDWIEASQSVGPDALVGVPTATAAPAATSTPVMVARSPEAPARPSPPELAILRVGAHALQRAGDAFLSGALVVMVIAVAVGAILLIRRMR